MNIDTRNPPEAVWRVKAPGDFVCLRAGTPAYYNEDDVYLAYGQQPDFRVQLGEFGTVISVADEHCDRQHSRDESGYLVCVFLPKRQRLVWVDAYWCSRM